MRLNGCKCVITSSQNYMSFKSRINRLLQQKDHQLACTLWGLYNKEVFFASLHHLHDTPKKLMLEHFSFNMVDQTSIRAIIWLVIYRYTITYHVSVV